MSFQAFPPVRRTLASASSTAQFTPLTGWVPAIQQRYLKALFDVQDASSEFRVQLAYQTALANPEAPDSPFTAGSEISGNGKVNTGRITLSTTNTDAKYWIRFGVMTRSTVDGTYAQGEVSFWLTTSI